MCAFISGQTSKEGFDQMCQFYFLAESFGWGGLNSESNEKEKGAFLYRTDKTQEIMLEHGHDFK